ncbi:hypothetical protein LJR219_002333 [Phenylobacterium sp. LjRoot219]|uniref:hypothetical protein n=1 Tax=Phenylobacterium sp. LjRoot219 TaxID=3342283 RepID=UPI003ECCDADA
MREFVDLSGASGTFYRFRIWPEGGTHPPIAGNYIVLRDDANGVKVLLAGVTSDLSQAANEAKKAMAKTPDARLYTRLNVARAVRTAEHEDIVAEHRPAVLSAGER